MKMDQEFSDSSEEKLQNDEDENQERVHLFGRQNPVHTALGGGKRTFSYSRFYDSMYVKEFHLI